MKVLTDRQYKKLWDEAESLLFSDKDEDQIQAVNTMDVLSQFRDFE